MPSVDGPAAPLDPPRSVSLTARLAGALALLLAAGGLLVAALAFAYGRGAARQAYDRLLVGAARQIADSTAPRDGAISVDLPVSAFELLALAPDDRVIYAVFAPDGRIVTGYDLPRPEPGFEGFYNGDFGGEPARFVVTDRLFAERDLSGPVAVVVGQTTRARGELARDITEHALVLVALAGLLMTALAAFAARSALEPLRRIERAIAGRPPTDLTPIGTPVPREIAGLTGALNRFMDRISRQSAATRTLIADASHQLRTPIAALRAQAELAAEEPDPARQRAIVGRIHDRSVTLSRLADQLLNHALIIHRADAVPRERLDLREVAIRATGEADRDLFASAAELHLDLPEEEVPCLGDALSLVEACKNLLFNALRHGRPPVTVSVRAEAGRAVLAVEDAGPGMPREHWADATTRYARGAGVSARSAGLGLAIVDAVARAHDGALRFGHTGEGHFIVALELPGVVR
ncbi:sensor histidine kinase [Amaricoccus solimangrovi]|uniref:histidine kinase n=1 Tax=Amaricoccus solimangrovi TaxID=2589815 RepID=A0A501X0N8_9RHOB|nr:sensor histidine kinase N-terminal domain-containing protein [Amaricoccus solimangrovi]TPE52456.1 HAMP domain-containing protein [Amaricoccus solimangrovi]